MHLKSLQLHRLGKGIWELEGETKIGCPAWCGSVRGTHERRPKELEVVWDNQQVAMACSRNTNAAGCHDNQQKHQWFEWYKLNFVAECKKHRAILFTENSQKADIRKVNLI